MQDIFSVLVFGFWDALNPCKVASLLLLGMLGSLLCRTLSATWRLFTWFIVSCVVATLIARLGVYDELILADLFSYQLMIIIFYQAVGFAFLIFGGRLFYLWSRILLGRKEVVLWGAGNGHPLLCKIVGIWLGILAGTAATFWPRSQAVAALTLKALFPGTLFEGSAMIVLHEVLSFWPWLVVLIFLYFLSRGGKFAGLISARRSLICIAVSALYFSLGGALLFLFFPKTAY